MPEICRFFGIIVSMNYNEHEPPHFHVRYGEQAAMIGIGALTLIEGNLSPRVLGLVIEWASMHLPELQEDWQRCKSRQPLTKIAPLE